MNGFYLCILASLAVCLSISMVQGNEQSEHTEHSQHNEHTTAGEEKEKLKYVVTNEVYLDIAIKDTHENTPSQVEKTGRIVIGLFGDITPMTSTNFVQICKGFKREGKKYSYKGSSFHRIVRDFVIQGGDIVTHDGTGSKSIYGEKFIDENFSLSHRSAGWVSMANYGSDTNGSQFFITLVPARWLDNHHVVFGRVLSGMALVREIGELETYKGSSIPKKTVEIVDSGVRETARHELSEEQLDSPGDIIHE